MISWFLADEVHLLNIGIAPAFQRRGYARRLMEHLVELAESDGREHIILEVREGNTAARNLYDSMGFAQIGTRKRYYEDSLEDAIVMILHLPSQKDSHV